MIFACVRALFILAAVDFAGGNSWVIGQTQLERAIASARKPNILFIFADDFAFDCTGFSGNAEIQTPNLDRLARRGTHFTHAYNMGGWNGAVCIASRAMLNTGQFLWRAQAGESRLQTEFVSPRRLWAQRLAAVGYETYFTGKWHVAAKVEDVFKTTSNIRGGMPKDHPTGYNRPQSTTDKDWLPWDTTWGGYWEGGRHWSTVVADDATGFLETAAKSEQPFFMYVAFNAPHDPRQAPQEFVAMYPVEKMHLPEPFYPEYPLAIGVRDIRDELLAPYPRTPLNVRANRAEYYALISHLDQEIGRVLQQLDKLKLTENTMIVFTADHGLAIGHHGLMGKQNLHDPSVRVPLLLAGPGIRENQLNSAPVYYQDLVPTTLEWAGAVVDQEIDFKSLRPLLLDPADQSYRAIYGAYTDTQRAVTIDQTKLIVYPKINQSQLFDLKLDPWETTDLSSDPAYATLRQRLFRELQKLQIQMGDKVALTID